MPFAKWPDFDACVLEQTEKGHSEDSAKRICGAIKARIEKNTAEITNIKLSDSESQYINNIMTNKIIKTFADLNNVEIFAIGNWNKDNYTHSDLNEMIDNFGKLREIVKPYAKIGHSEDQKLLNSEGLPAAGWVDSIKMVGNKVVATFKDVPRVVKDLIDKKAYRRVSAEIYPKYKNPADGKIYRNVLRAVAFLGGETPAVETLSDIQALYSARNDANNEFKIYNIDIETINKIQGGDIVGKYRIDIDGTSKDELVKKLSNTFGEGVKVNVEDQDAIDAEEKKKIEDDIKNKEIKDKKIEELTQQYEAVNKLQGDKDKTIADLQAKIKELEDKISGKDTEMVGMKTQCDEMSKKFTEANDKLEKISKDAKIENIRNFVKQQITDGKILPKDENVVVALMEQLDDKAVLKFTQDNKEASESMADVIKRFITNLPQAVNFSEISPNPDGNQTSLDSHVVIGGVRYEVKDSELMQKAEKYAQDNKVAFDVALLEVSKVV